ncbi:hypothetical protein ACH3VR_09060 [Microbacterium sp. B2969]|uniref:DUF4878 domain-containing protein n=1 Tax=Microbacterium alkaliflavum TaxID=3248839 RepID=A0ABW7Q8L0_9MICO
MRRGVVVAVAIAVAIVVVGGGLAWWLLSRPPGPEDTARGYLEALAAGDADRALSYAQPSDADLKGAFEGADEYLTEPSVGDVADAGDEATAAVTFRLDGSTQEATLPLARHDGRWVVDSGGFGALTATTTIGDHVIVGDAVLPAGEDLQLLPAVYPVHAAPRGLLDGSTPVTVLPGAHADAAVEASVSPDATRLAQQQLDVYAADCTRAATTVPTNCGLRVPWAADLATLSSIVFRVEQTPQVALAPDLRSFAATGGVVVATATGTTRGGDEASFTYSADDWALRGTIALTAEGMTLAVG